MKQFYILLLCNSHVDQQYSLRKKPHPIRFITLDEARNFLF